MHRDQRVLAEPTAALRLAFALIYFIFGRRLVRGVAQYL